MERKVYEFMSKQNNDPIVEWKTCKISGEPFAVFQSDLDFYDKVSPVFDGKKFQFPVPDIRPEERQRVKLAHVNQINLFKTKCNVTGDAIISNHMPTTKYRIVSQKYFWWDTCDNVIFWREYNDARSFFEQRHELDMQAYQPALFSDYTKDINSAYTNYAGMNKDCYMAFDSDQNDNCYYSYGVNHSKYTVDCYRSGELEYCYEAIDSRECYKCAYIQNCKSCFDSYFLRNCENCKNCIMCSNLINKQYYIANKQVTPEAFEAYKKNITSNTQNIQLQKDFDAYIRTFPQRYMIGVQNENVSGNFLVNCKNVHFSYDSMNTRDAKYVTQVFIESKNSMDCDECWQCEVTYQSSNVGYNAYRIFFSYQCLNDLQNLYYCKNCFFCKNCFACIGLKHKEYCIFNKQYTQADYEKEVARIISRMEETGERGNYYPAQYANFPYNQTMAQEYYPLTKDEALKQWYQWSEDEKQYINKTYAISDAIDAVEETITKEVLTCESTGRNYIITPQELSFYKKIGVPVPRSCFWARHMKRLHKRPARVLNLRTCDNCWREIVSIYPQNGDFKVYCEVCYNKEVY